MVGKGVLLECLDHTEVDKVLCIVRSEIDIQHEKLEQVVHKDFSDYQLIKDKLIGFDACFLCMGVSSAGLDEVAYTQITYNYTMALATTLYEINPGITLTYVSGEGTDSSEKAELCGLELKERLKTIY